MQRVRISLLVIFLNYAFAGNTPLNNDPNTGSNPQLYGHSVYLILYLFFWCFLIDISLAIMMHFKHTKYYIANHSFINICIVIG